MPDPSVQNNPLSHDVNLQAFLYASGELEGIEAASFERRLGEEQAAREALSQAVLLCQPLGSQISAGPNPVYRECVRRRLRPRPNMERIVEQPRADRGHPVIWSVLGAAAAVLLLFSLERLGSRAVPDGAGGVTVAERGPSSTVPGDLDDPPNAFVSDVALVWAKLPNGEHLRMARAEEMRRKSRAEDFQRLATPHQQHPRELASPTLKN
jgi:hypothetical protein